MLWLQSAQLQLSKKFYGTNGNSYAPRSFRRTCIDRRKKNLHEEIYTSEKRTISVDTSALIDSLLVDWQLMTPMCFTLTINKKKHKISANT